jgi:hypothetical protein
MSAEYGGDHLSALMDGQRLFSQNTRPFASLEEFARTYLNHLEAHRFIKQPESDRAGSW